MKHKAHQKGRNRQCKQISGYCNHLLQQMNNCDACRVRIQIDNMALCPGQMKCSVQLQMQSTKTKQEIYRVHAKNWHGLPLVLSTRIYRVTIRQRHCLTM